jgi:hypothetical protein
MLALLSEQTIACHGMQLVKANNMNCCGTLQG